MKKFYRTIILLLVLVLLSTYSQNQFNLNLEKKNTLFKVKTIKVLNNFLISENEIKKNLENIYNMNIFLIKRKDIEDPLKKINFFDNVEVKRKYPHTIIVKITETEPIANLFKNKVKYLLDSSSNLITSDKNFDNLPSIFGEESENYFVDFLNILKKNNFPVKKIKNYYYFQIGRWDIQLANNKIIKLPYNNINEAIKKTIKLLEREDFENYKIIDLRVDGKIIVE